MPDLVRSPIPLDLDKVPSDPVVLDPDPFDLDPKPVVLDLDPVVLDLDPVVLDPDPKTLVCENDAIQSRLVRRSSSSGPNRQSSFSFLDLGLGVQERENLEREARRRLLVRRAGGTRSTSRSPPVWMLM